MEVVGTCQGITEKPSGWTEFEIAVPGKQYPVRLATKAQPLVGLARALAGGVGTWTYNEVESEKINEHTGKPYVNRYLESVEAGAAAATSSPEPDQKADSKDVDWDAKERRDFMSRAWSQTLAAWQHTINEGDDPLLVFARLQPFQRKVYQDVCGRFAYPEDNDDVPFQ